MTKREILEKHINNAFFEYGFPEDDLVVLEQAMTEYAEQYHLENFKDFELPKIDYVIFEGFGRHLTESITRTIFLFSEAFQRENGCVPKFLYLGDACWFQFRSELQKYNKISVNSVIEEFLGMRVIRDDSDRFKIMITDKEKIIGKNLGLDKEKFEALKKIHNWIQEDDGA